MWNTAKLSWSDAAVIAFAVAAAMAAATWTAAGPPRVIVAAPPVAVAAPPARPAADDARPVIGIVPSSDPQITAALVAGATRALDESRAAGGPDLSLVVGAATAQWASVASEAARLACDEHVVALIAPPERALAHPAAQAATRCGVPLLSTCPAASVTAAGSRWVLSVVAVGGDAPTDAPAAKTAAYDAARVVVEAVRRAGLSRDAVLGAARDGTPVTVAAGDLRFDTLGRRVSVAK
jgi:ABC-type branched-subunit amino acid transport system substrate-binding protein